MPARTEADRKPLHMAQEWGADAAFDMYRGSLVAYSALRDPVDGIVRIFLDAEPFLAKALTCHFQARLRPVESSCTSGTSHSRLYDLGVLTLLQPSTGLLSLIALGGSATF